MLPITTAPASVPKDSYSDPKTVNLTAWELTSTHLPTPRTPCRPLLIMPTNAFASLLAGTAPELLGHILSYLSPRDLASISQTCKAAAAFLHPAPHNTHAKYEPSSPCHLSNDKSHLPIAGMRGRPRSSKSLTIQNMPGKSYYRQHVQKTPPVIPHGGIGSTRRIDGSPHTVHTATLVMLVA